MMEEEKILKDIFLYNTKTRMREKFVPLENKKVRFYSCGPTTYDFIHVGNARALVTADMILRIFKTFSYDVSFVRNFTDIDDKIINRANELKVNPLLHSAKYIEECKVDMQALNLLTPSYTPKVTETIPEIISLIETLVKKNHAYVVDGEVLFSVESFPGYGLLSGRDLESQESGKRVRVSDNKKSSYDFVLWRPAKEGEPSWDSPWGKGRPGWHIECSAMALKFLGETIDIHHGGSDLLFPHHENEVAQSEAATGKVFCNTFCYNAFLNFGQEKMSKSLGNVITVRAFTQKFPGMVLRQILSTVHYRSILDWNEDALRRAMDESERIHTFILKFKNYLKENNEKILSSFESSQVFDKKNFQEIENLKVLTNVLESIDRELRSDFNVPASLSEFFILIRTFNREYLENKNLMSKETREKIESIIYLFSESTGLISSDPEKLLSDIHSSKKNLTESSLSAEEILKLIEERKEARRNKNFKRADEIRTLFEKQFILLKDRPDGSVEWSYKAKT